MNIWLAKLKMHHEHNTFDFEFAKQDKEFKINKYFPNDEWVSIGEGWLSDKIPMKMKVEEFYGDIIIEQGFDRELSIDELEELEDKMKIQMMEYLFAKRGKILRTLNNKISAIKDNLKEIEDGRKNTRKSNKNKGGNRTS